MLCLIKKTYLALIFILVAVLFSSCGGNKEKEYMGGTYGEATINQDGKVLVNLFFNREALPNYIKEFDSFEEYTKETVKTLYTNCSDEDTMKLKIIKNCEEYYQVRVQTRRINFKNNQALGWFEWDRYNKYASNKSVGIGKLELYEKGNLSSSVSSVIGDFLNKVNIQKNNKKVVPYNIKTGKIETTEEFSQASKKDKNSIFTSFKIPKLDFLDKVVVKFPGKIKYISTLIKNETKQDYIKVISNNELEITPIELSALYLGQEYDLDEEENYKYDEDGKIKIKEVGVKENSKNLFGYVVYDNGPNKALIIVIIALIIVIIGLLAWFIGTKRYSNPRLRKKLKQIKKHSMLYIMVIPAVVLAIIFCYIPMFGVIIAFKDFNLLDGVFGSEWVGIKYFKYIIQGKDPNVYLVFRNTIYISIIRIASNFPAILLFALMINEIKSRKIKTGVRTISYLPNFISWIAVGGMMIGIFTTDGGLLNKVITFVSGKKCEINWYAEPGKWWWILALGSMWKSIGWGTIIYMSGLCCINQDLYEACEIDGGGRFTKIRTVTIPGISNIIVFQLIMDVASIIGDNYEQVLAMTQGSGLLTETTYIVGSMTFSAISGGSGYSQATTFSLIQGTIGLLLLLLTNRVAKKRGNEGVM